MSSSSGDADHSSSDSSGFEIQAVKSADGLTASDARSAVVHVRDTGRTSANARQSENSEKDLVTGPRAAEQSRDVGHGQAAERPSKGNGLIGLGNYSGSESSSSSAGEKQRSVRRGAATEHVKRLSVKKRVRFADDVPPEKRARTEESSIPHANGHVEEPQESSGEEEEDDLMAEFAQFEAAVQDIGRDTEQMDEDFTAAEDAREEAQQRELENRLRNLRERRLRIESNLGADGAHQRKSDDARVATGSDEERADDEEGDSDGDVDLMKDWLEAR